MENRPVNEEELTKEPLEAEAGQEAAATSPEEAGEKKAEEPKLDKNGKPKKSLKREIFEWVITILAAVAIALTIRTLLFEPVRVDGASMNDTLADGEVMFVTKTDYLLGQPNRFDVVICHYPDRGNTNFVKRIIGMPGDVLELKDGYLTVNGVSYEETYVNDEYRKTYYTNIGPYTVPKKGDVIEKKGSVITLNGKEIDRDLIYGCVGTNYLNAAASTSYAGEVYAGKSRVAIVGGTLYVDMKAATEDGTYTISEDYFFVMGDHRNNSNDSRAQGPISRSMIVGHVQAVFLPFNKVRSIPNPVSAK